MTRPAPYLLRWLQCGAALASLGLVSNLGRAQSALVANSPFTPSGTSAGATAAAAQDFELTGSTAEGSTVTVCIYARQTKRSQWIPVGGVSDGVRVISYDADHDRAVVMVGGVRKDVAMRKATFGGKGGSAAPAPMLTASTPAALPPYPAAGLPPVEGGPATKPEAEQREARMLVSDLLEIGVQQRKAFQEARQKAAAPGSQAPSN
jgi:hypothetical protein